MGLSRLVAMVVRTAVVAGVTCLLATGPVTGAAQAAVPQAAQGNGVSAKTIALIKKVHQASLVEIWAGKRAQQFGVSPAVKWVGRGLITDHVFLEQKVAEAAQQLNLKLPAEPDLQQQAGIRKMARVTGPEFDRAFANVLHFGHSIVLPMAQAVVAENSSNPIARQMGSLGVSFVSKHLAWLEATGLVTNASSSLAAAQVQAAQATSNVKTYNNALPALVGLGSLAALLLTVTYLVMRPRRAAEQAPRSGRGSRAAGGSPHRVASHAR